MTPLEVFISIGLSESKALETLKNESLSKNLREIIEYAQTIRGYETCNKLLLYHLASKIKPQIADRKNLLVKYIVSGNLNSAFKVDCALEFLLSHSCGEIDVKNFEEACGVGVEITPEDIELAVELVVKKYKDEILSKRYTFNKGILMREVNNNLKWADGKDIKNEIEVQILDILGPKTEEDLMPVSKKKNKSNQSLTNKKEESTKGESVKETKQNITEESILDVLNKVNFHKPGENFKTDGYVKTPTTLKLMEQHLKMTGGKVRTRFPPEPNGILHIGHAKAININFGYAAVKNGVCFLRYDDTNPEKEEEKFFLGIKDIVEWLGYSPFKITHSSDYFDQLFKWAVILIKKGLAYVCHQKQEEMQGFNPPPSPWRDRPIQESLLLFESMKNGKIDEGCATLRMKVTLEEGKQDPVAYRIKFIPHHRTGSKWCIYPTYDYTHCLCDSIEHITHSLCTKEFQSRRSSYYWLCNALDIYCPVQWEYGRLNMNYTVVSKRKIAKLIDAKIVRDWDDPRLFTLSALRRRGFPAEAINKFCAKMGVTGAQTVVDPSMLEASVRDHLNTTASRTMVVLDPIEICIENSSDNLTFDVPDFPADPSSPTHKIHLKNKTVYIERSDFLIKDQKGFRRLSPSQPVGLRYTGLVITLKQIIKEGDVIKKLIVTGEPVSPVNKPKAFIHWVSNPLQVTIRLYENLFKHKNPEDLALVPGGYLSDLVENSFKEITAFADRHLQTCKVYDKYQFERVGFFSVDPDTNHTRVVFNRTVLLKEDSAKE